MHFFHSPTTAPKGRRAEACGSRVQNGLPCTPLALIEHDSLGDRAEERGDLGVDAAAGGRTGERLVCDQQVIHTSLKISSFQGLMMIVGTQ